VADWGGGVSASCSAAPWVQLSVSAGNGWPRNALRHHWLMPISCHFRYCKALLVTSLTHVNSAIASVQTFIGLLISVEADSSVTRTAPFPPQSCYRHTKRIIIRHHNTSVGVERPPAQKTALPGLTRRQVCQAPVVYQPASRTDSPVEK